MLIEPAFFKVCVCVCVSDLLAMLVQTSNHECFEWVGVCFFK